MPRPFLDISPGHLEQAFHFNVSTAHALLRAGGARSCSQGDGGSVVNISSPWAGWPGRGFVAYGTAKAALSHYTRLAAADLAPRIRVNAIAVGLGRHLGPRHRDADRRAPDGHGGGDPARPHRGTRGHRRGRRLPGLAGRLATSPARSSRSTAASSAPSSTWACPTSEPADPGPTPTPGRGAPMTKTYRVVAWSTGNVGRHAIAGIDARPDLELVGRLGVEPRQGRARTPATWPGSAARSG